MICKIPYQSFLCFIGRFLKKGRIVKQCYVCRRYMIEGKWTYKVAAEPSRIENGVCPKCIPGEVERVGKILMRKRHEAEIEWGEAQKSAEAAYDKDKNFFRNAK